MSEKITQSLNKAHGPLVFAGVNSAGRVDEVLNPYGSSERPMAKNLKRYLYERFVGVDEFLDLAPNIGY